MAERKLIVPRLKEYLGEDVIGRVTQIVQEGGSYVLIAKQAGVSPQHALRFFEDLRLPHYSYRLKPPLLTIIPVEGLPKRRESVEDPLAPYEVDRYGQNKYFREFDLLNLHSSKLLKDLYQFGFDSLRGIDEINDNVLTRVGIKGDNLGLLRERIDRFRAYLKYITTVRVLPVTPDNPIIVDPKKVGYELSLHRTT